MSESKYAVHYFDFNGSRGQMLRHAFTLAGQDFTDQRYKRNDWKAVKPTFTWKSMPKLDTPDGNINQSLAALIYVGEEFNLFPIGFNKYKAIELIFAIEDISGSIGSTISITDPALKQQMRERIDTERLPGFFDNVVAFLNTLTKTKDNGYVFDDISIADVVLYEVLRWLNTGVLDHISKVPMEKYPRFQKFVTEYENNDKIKAYNAQLAK